MLNRASLLAYAGIPPSWAEFRFANPSILPPSAIYQNSVAFSPSGDAIAMSYNSSPFLSVYQFSSSGFGTRYPNASGGVFSSTSSGGTGVQVVRFSPSGSHILFAEANNLHVIEWNSVTGFGARYTYVNPPDSISGAIRTAEWSANGQHIFIGNAGACKIGAIPFTGSGFGTLIEPSASFATTGTPRAIAVSASGQYIVMAGTTSDIAAQYYPWTGSSFGNRVQLITPFSSSPFEGATIHPSESFLAVSGNTYGLRIFNWSPGALGAQVGITYGAFAIGGPAEFNAAGNLLMINASSTGPRILQFDSGKLTTQLRNPDEFQIPALNFTCKFSSNGAYFAYASSTTPFIHTYKISTL